MDDKGVDMSSGLGQSDNSIGAAILSLRSLAGLSQRELARRSGLTNSVISTIEQGKVSPSVVSLQKILTGLGLSLAQFFRLLEALPETDATHQQLSPAVTQERILLCAGETTPLLLTGDTVESLVCTLGEASLRSYGKERVLHCGELATVHANSAYTLTALSAGAELWLAKPK